MTYNFKSMASGAVDATTAPQTLSLAQITGYDAGLLQFAPDVMLDNRGDFDAYILCCWPNGVASRAGIRIPAGCISIWGKSNAPNLAVIAEGPTKLAVFVGEGA